MRFAILMLCFVVAVAFVGIALASPPGKIVEYPGGDVGKVIFNGSTHSVTQGMKCPDCHPAIFPMKRGEFKMTKEDHATDKGCGACHNGTKAFSQTDEAGCVKCHKKAQEETREKEKCGEETPKEAAEEAGETEEK